MSAKPIFEQLQANADKKQEEYDAVTKALQAAACPQALDEDDVNHFESLEQRKAAQKQVGGDAGTARRACSMVRMGASVVPAPTEAARFAAAV